MKLLKNKNTLPDWYPLDVYEKNLNGEEWLQELATRFMLKFSYENTSDKAKAIDSFTSFFVNRNIFDKGLINETIKANEVWGVKELSAFDLGYLSLMANDSENSTDFYKEINSFRKTESLKVVASPPDTLKKLKAESFGSIADFSKERLSMREVLTGFPVTVDLDQNDETLKLAFSVWLAGVRDTLGQEKKPFCNKDFDDWSTYGVLQYFDLQFWALINVSAQPTPSNNPVLFRS